MAKQHAKKSGVQDQPYNFPKPVEEAIAFLACTNPRFMARVAHELRSDLLHLPECRNAVESAQAIFRDLGRGPQHPTEVIAHAAARRDGGKLTQEEVMAVGGLFDLYEGSTPPDADATEAQLIPVLRKRLRHAIAQAAVSEYNEEGWEQLHAMLRREAALGSGEGGLGVSMTKEKALEAVRRLRGIQRAPFGIDVLDTVLDNGVPIGTLTCFMAGPGGAKSMTMSHIAGQLSLRGKLCAYATLELPVEQVVARIAANITGVTINEITGGQADDELSRRWDAYNPTPTVVQDFTPHATTVDILTDWVENIQRHLGRKVDALIVDYADKLTAMGKIEDKSSYQEMRIVYEKLRIYCHDHQILGITASQSRARDEKKSKVIDLEHIADSMHKARVVDQFVTLNFDDDTKEMTFFVAKSRYSEGRKKAGPVPTNFACGQVAPVERAPILAPSISAARPPPSLEEVSGHEPGAIFASALEELEGKDSGEVPF